LSFQTLVQILATQTSIDICRISVFSLGSVSTAGILLHGFVRFAGFIFLMHSVLVQFQQVAKQTENLPHVWDLCIVEMVIRSAKHILKGVLRETLDQDVGGAIAHFFNCLVGPETVPSNSEVTVVSNGKPEKSEANSVSGVFLSYLAYLDTKDTLGVMSTCLLAP
jgi:hypothetical protein